MNLKQSLSIVLIAVLQGCNSNQEKADLIITNATIWTADPVAPFAESMAISGDIIMSIGDNASIEQLKGRKTEVINAEGKFITPGFIDSHVHFIAGGTNLSSVQLRDASTPGQFINRIATYARSIPEGEWILGGDWDHKLWGGELPQKEWIDSVTQHNPVMITRLDGHMALVNSITLGHANVGAETEDVEGGEIVRDQSGNITGIFKDNAMSLIYEQMPAPSKEQLKKSALTAMEHVASHGVTSVQDMGSFPDELSAFEELKNEGKSITRIYYAFPLSNWQGLKQKITEDGIGDDWLKIGVLKGFVDGSLGSHTAAFFDPFTDAPGDKGFFINSKQDLYNWISTADREGLQIVVHAIGDSANSTLLDIYKQVTDENGPRDRRFRIEHAQHIAPKDFSRFEKLEVIASVQPYHAIDDGRWAENVIGPERIKTTYPFRSFIDAGAKIAMGSDWFVAPPVPIMGIYAAVTRATLDGKNRGGWVPEQKITVEEALRGYTISAAYASFDEQIKGSLEVGKLADFVILDKNLFEIEPEAIRDVRVEMTFVGGDKVFDNVINK